MRFTLGLFIGLCLFSKLAPASFDKNKSLISANNPNTCFQNGVSKKDLQNHVEFLSSNALEGRLTGSLGEQRATQYVADVFHCLGLDPAGDKGTFFQEFAFTSGVSLGKNNSFLVTNQKGTTQHLLLDYDWRPLSFSDTISFESAELVFAGYGINAPASGNLPTYDSYRGLNVKGKWVVVFRYTPEKISAEQSRQLNPYASPRYKVFTAKEHGAKGIIFVSGPNSKVQHELIPLSFDASLSGSGIAAISVSDKTLDDLLKNSGNSCNSLQKLQDKLDLGQQDHAIRLNHIKIAGRINIEQNKKQGRNVLAKLRINHNEAQMMIISAHVDHLGHGELSGSRENEKGMIHYGADDNASGVANVLAAATHLSKLKTKNKLHGNKDILFAVWSGEELGLLGSGYFVKNFLEQSKENSLHPFFAANINLDMVGRLRKNLIIQSVGSSSIWPKLITQVKMSHPIALITQNDPYLPTDSTSFYLHGVPTLNFFTGSHDEYHTSRDTPQTLNYEGMSNISEFLVDLILALEKEPNSINYHQVSKISNNHRQGLRIYLGTIPDYSSPEISGVKLSGVTKDSPAERAGIRANDIIVELAGKKIHDIYDYTFVLNALHVGEHVALIVLRGNKRVPMAVVTQSRD